MTIKQLHYFISVAETKSFTHAARNYFIAQTAMSQQISALEKELGFLLFHRTNRSVVLTEAGQLLYHRLRPLVLDLESALSDAAALAGTQDLCFRIGLYDQAINRFLAPALRAFSQEEPSVFPQLISDNLPLLLEGLSTRRLDVVLLGKQFYTPRSTLTAVELFSYQVLNHVLVVPEGHPLAQRDSLSWPDLSGLQLIAYSPLREDQQGASLQALLGSHGVSATVAHSVREIPTALLYVEAGLGCCLLPALAADRENLQVQMLPLEEDQRDTMLLLAHRDSESHLVSRFTAICQRTLRGT